MKANIVTNNSTMRKYMKYLYTSLLLFCFAIGKMWASPGTFTKITSTDDFTTGYYVLVASESSTSNANYAMGASVTTTTAKNVLAGAVTITNGTTITNPHDSIVYKVTKTADGWIFQNVKTSQYLCENPTTTSTNRMAFQAASILTFDEATYQSTAPIGFCLRTKNHNATSHTNRRFKYNAGSQFFSNYGEGSAYTNSMTPVRLFKLSSRFTVTFNAEGGICGTASLTESSPAAGVVLPSASPDASCASVGWVFDGWATSTCSETTTSPTVYTAGSTYHPAGDETLHAVYRLVSSDNVTTTDTIIVSSQVNPKWEKGGRNNGAQSYASKTSLQLYNASGADPDGYIQTKLRYVNPSAITLVATGNNQNVDTLKYSTDGVSWTKWTNYCTVPKNTSAYSTNSFSMTSFPTGIYYLMITCNKTSHYIFSVAITSKVTTYNSNPDCTPTCSDLDTPENLAESNLTPTSVQLSWDAVTNASSYTVTIEGDDYEKVVNNIATTSVTIDDLSEGCGAEYLWTVKAIGDGEDYCDSEESETADFTTPTLSSIALSGTYPTDFAVGDAFSHEGQIVTATYNNGATKVVTGSCIWTGYNMSSGGDQTVTVSYTECTTPRTATYGIHVATYSDYVFSCAELTLEAHPETENAPIFITSVAGKKVRSQGYIQITGSGLTPSTTLTFPDLNSKFEIKTAAYGDLATDATGAIDVAAYIFYTPDAGATSDGLDKIAGISVSVGGAKPKQVSLLQSIIGRHLPADFVIAGKKDGKWYALPSNMESTDHPAPAEIAVDNATNPAIAYTDASNKYGLEGPTTSPSGNIKSGVGQYVKLTMHPLSDAPLFGMAPSNTAIGKSGTAVATHDLSAGYWWQLKQTNTSITNPQDAKYTIYCANNTSSLSIKDNAGSPEWGLYASGVEELRLIPASSIVFAEAEIVEWGQHGAIIEVDATAISATKVKAILNETESAIIAVSQTGTSVKGSSTKYNYTAAFGDGIDFAAATSNGAMLTLEWYNSSSVLVGVSNINVPKIIAANATMSSIASGDAAWSSAEVHVLPGVTLEANAGSFLSSDVTIDQLEIYPGATVQVTTGTLDVRKLVLRNGWKRIGGTAYNTAHLYIADDANLTKTNAVDIWYSDWYIDYDQYYPIAVPWDVTVANMSYKNTKNAASAGVKLLYYDGESRADNAQTGVGDGANWKEYGADGNKPKPTTLKPGMGCAMTARRPTGKAFSIVRLPMSFSNAWGADGEQGEVGGAHKDQVAVIAYGVGAEPAKPTYLVGWNFIANPYMANYQGTIEYADGDKINVVNIPDVSFNEYGQYATATTKLAPASGFLIQAPKDGTLTFGSANRKNAAPGILKTKQADAVPEQQAYILLKNESAEDMMGLFVSEKYTADYDLNGDVEKLLSSGTSLRTYMHFGDMDMAYVAINEALAKEWIPVTIRIPEAGEYAFSIHEASIAGELEGVYLIDYENSDKVTNLLEENYPFYSEAGTASGRFAINAVIGKRVPTDIDAVNAGTDSTKPVKFIYRENVYILHHGAIYDATGKKVREINK